MNLAHVGLEPTTGVELAQTGRVRVYSCRYEIKIWNMWRGRPRPRSREAATECSPRRKPWVKINLGRPSVLAEGERSEPRRGERAKNSNLVEKINR
jgi:hypothetical protein